MYFTNNIAKGHGPEQLHLVNNAFIKTIVIPMVLFVNVLVEKWRVHKLVIVEHNSLNPKEHRDKGEEKVEVAIFIHLVVEHCAVSVGDPACQKP